MGGMDSLASFLDDPHSDDVVAVAGASKRADGGRLIAIVEELRKDPELLAAVEYLIRRRWWREDKRT